ncbi:hypothetical protein SAMN04488128_1011419 [Chitinophaga eiseniae]|uniref:AhpC/TSA family protein n=1 Tax=Chitinophaga eiseniae TaxID=634771 RepID=A0A1T4N5B3_9BACT|nr:hypothetical protein [Chitinophaga eiseniae]SJZ74078.1 hypothetical protein SAMN04488128_1011419 [Chitinophaga eiseniae]
MKYFFAVVTLLMTSQCRFLDPDARRLGKPMPSIDVLLLDSATVVNTKNLPNASATVLVLFDPYCEICSNEISAIMKSINKFDNTQFCFMSIASIADIRTFYASYMGKKYPNVHIGVDTGWAYLRYFKPLGVPHTSVFSSKKKLKKEFLSQVTVEQLLAEVK